MRRYRSWPAAAMLALSIGVFAGRPAMALGYQECVSLVEKAPAEAEVAARRWIDEGGGAAARHCLALALVAQGAERRGAALMTRIAAEERLLPDAVRAELLIEAGEIYLGIGELGAARTAAREALRLAPDPAPAHVLAARVAAAKADWRGALDELDKALAAGEPEAATLVLRASARIHLDDLAGAASDLAAAGKLAPDLPELWLERGRLAAAKGARDAARRAFLGAIERDREGPVGAAARLGLQRMEAGD